MPPVCVTVTPVICTEVAALLPLLKICHFQSRLSSVPVFEAIDADNGGAAITEQYAVALVEVDVPVTAAAIEYVPGATVAGRVSVSVTDVF